MLRSASLLLICFCGCVGCTTGRKPDTASARPTDDVYYVARPDADLTRRRLLPDPINGLGQTNDPNLRVTDVQVTSRFTVVYLSFQDRTVQGDGSRISFSAEKSHLVTPDGQRRFNFLRAEGISLAPIYQDVKPGERVDFTLYFDPLPADVTEFGLYECESDNGNVCWNIRSIILPPAPTR